MSFLISLACLIIKIANAKEIKNSNRIRIKLNELIFVNNLPPNCKIAFPVILLPWTLKLKPKISVMTDKKYT